MIASVHLNAPLYVVAMTTYILGISVIWVDYNRVKRESDNAISDLGETSGRKYKAQRRLPLWLRQKKMSLYIDFFAFVFSVITVAFIMFMDRYSVPRHVVFELLKVDDLSRPTMWHSAIEAVLICVPIVYAFRIVHVSSRSMDTNDSLVKDIYENKDIPWESYAEMEPIIETHSKAIEKALDGLVLLFILDVACFAVSGIPYITHIGIDSRITGPGSSEVRTFFLGILVGVVMLTVGAYDRIRMNNAIKSNADSGPSWKKKIVSEVLCDVGILIIAKSVLFGG